MNEYVGNCGCDNLKARIQKVFRRYCECNDNGDLNPEYDDCYTAQDALDDIHTIIGEF